MTEHRYTVEGIRYSSLKLANAVRRQKGLKRCSKCGETYPIAQFPADQSRADGLYPQCLGCLAAYRESTRKQRREYARSRYSEQRDPDQAGLLLTPPP